jgi:hypothetical protein
LAANVAHPDPEDAIDDIRNVHGPTAFKVVSSLVTLPALKVHWRYGRQDCRVCKKNFQYFSIADMVAVNVMAQDRCPSWGAKVARTAAGDFRLCPNCLQCSTCAPGPAS